MSAAPGRRSRRRRAGLAVAAMVAIVAAAVVVGLWVGGGDDESGDAGGEAGASIAEIAARPERFAGRRVSVSGIVSQTGRGQFVVSRGRSHILVAPGLRERAVRVERLDPVRVTGVVRVVDRPSDPRAAPIPDYDERAVIVPERIERVEEDG